MKIGIVAPAHNPLPSPKDRIWAPGAIISSLASGLIQSGHEVFLFTTNDSTVTKQKNLNIEYAGINSIYHDLPEIRANNFAKFTELFAMYDSAIYAKLFDFTKNNHLDLLHFHDIRRSLFLKDIFNTPILFTYHTILDTYYTDWLNAAAKKFNRMVNISALTSHHSQQLREYFKNIFIVPNGVDIAHYKFKACQNDRFLFAGRMIKQKGVEDAVKVAASAKIGLDIVGHEGDLKEDKLYFTTLKKKIDLTKNVSYNGYYDYKSMPSIYANAKAIIVPVLIEEPFGLTMVEAMACGTPVIAYNIGSVKELVRPGKTGFICPLGDTDAMVKAVKTIVTMPEADYQVMRKNCRKHVEENFSIEKMVEGYEKVYKEIIAKA